jgi:hypothetical protein
MNAIAEDIWKILHELAQSQKETYQMFKETDLKFKETDLKFKKTDLEIDKVSAMIGRLGNKLGDFVEEMVRPAAVRLFRERGVDVHEVYQNVESKRGDETIEIDLLVVNDTDVVAIECKSTLGIDDVNEHLERLAKLKRLLPGYSQKRVLGAVSGMVTPDNVARYAYNKGLFVIAQSSDHLLIRNDAKFVPGVW